MVSVHANGWSRRSNRIAQKLVDHLSRAEDGVSPIAYAVREAKKFEVAKSGNGSELTVDAFHVRPTPDVGQFTNLHVDIRMRIDRRRLHHQRGSYVHTIALEVEKKAGEEARIVGVGGLVGLDPSKDKDRFNIPERLTMITRPAIERDLAYLSLRLKDQKTNFEDMPLEIRNALATSFDSFIALGQAKNFPQILPTVAPLRGGKLRGYLAR